MIKKYLFLTIFAAVGWGFSGTCSEHLFKAYDMNPEWLTSIRLMSAGLILILIALAKGQGPSIKKLWHSKKDLPVLIGFAICGMMSVQYTYLMAIQATNSGTATILQYIGPVFILIYVCIVGQRLPRWRENLSLLGILLGAFLISTHGNLDTLVISKAGLFWGLISAFFMAVHDIMPINLLRKWNSLIITGFAMFIGGAVLFLVTHPWHFVPIITLDSVLTFLGLVLVGTVFSFTAFLIGISKIGPVNASIVAGVEPISASIFSFLWIGTHFTIFDIIGMAFILVAIFVLTTAPSHS